MIDIYVFSVLIYNYVLVAYLHKQVIITVDSGYQQYKIDLLCLVQYLSMSISISRDTYIAYLSGSTGSLFSSLGMSLSLKPKHRELTWRYNHWYQGIPAD